MSDIDVKQTDNGRWGLFINDILTGEKVVLDWKVLTSEEVKQAIRD